MKYVSQCTKFEQKQVGIVEKGVFCVFLSRKKYYIIKYYIYLHPCMPHLFP